MENTNPQSEKKETLSNSESSENTDIRVATSTGNPQNRKTKSRWLPLIFAGLIIAGLLLGYLLGSYQRSRGPHGKFDEILDVIASEYVDEVDLDSLIEKTVPLMLRNLDPHSVYISKADLEKANADLEGTFYGIGIRYMVVSDTIMVTEIIEGGPAEKSGMMPGDRIVEVDSTDIIKKKISNDDVTTLLKGPKGTSVTVKIVRPGESDYLTKTLTRDEVSVPSIDAAFMANENTGYVKVNKFARNTYQEFIQALMQLTLEGAEQYIIDLRGNTGGWLDAAVMMVNEFLPEGKKIVETRGRDASDNSLIISDGAGIYGEAPVTVLIDEISASSSEIFAAAIQDNDRGLIVGRRSFGKGLVQKPILLSDSSEIRLTVQRYYTPSGRCIQKKYMPGNNFDYEAEILERYNGGEVFGEEKGAEVPEDEKYFTEGGREVHGGGGITPDVIVPIDSTGMSSYYLEVAEKGLIQQYAFEIADLNRATFSKCKTIDELLSKLPSNAVLVRSFAQYAAQHGVPARWYYINKSTLRIVNLLKAWIANDIFGIGAFYEVTAKEDPAFLKAMELARHGVKPLEYKK